MLAGTAAEHKARAELFAPNTALCKITEDLVFTDPYREAPLNRWTSPYLDAEKRAFERDSALKVAAQARKYQFMTSAQALIHGDLHTGSIMVTPEDTRVIDPEFAFMGPIGFDVGAVIGNLLLAFFAQEGHEAAPRARDAYRDWILAQAENVWSGFNRRFLELWRAAPSGDAYPASLFTSDEDRQAMEKERARFMRVLFEDTLAFAGAKMIRRILGLAHVEDLEAIADPERRARCEIKALRLARELVVGAKGFSDVADVVSAARAVGCRREPLTVRPSLDGRHDRRLMDRGDQPRATNAATPPFATRRSRLACPHAVSSPTVRRSRHQPAGPRLDLGPDPARLGRKPLGNAALGRRAARYRLDRLGDRAHIQPRDRPAASLSRSRRVDA